MRVLSVFHWLFLSALSVTFIHALLPEKTWAEDVPYGQSFQTDLPNGKTWQWQITSSKGLKKLIVQAGGHAFKTKKPLLEADISDCYFCSGKDDNCSADGIKISQISRHPNPIVQLICHVGAHSQRLMIFDPQQDKNMPVFQRTGLYWINAAQKEHRLSITYDKSGFGSACPDAQASAAGICEVQEHWP